MAWLAFDSMMCPFTEDYGFENVNDAQLYNTENDIRAAVKDWARASLDANDVQIVKLYEITEHDARLASSYRISFEIIESEEE